jgi:hypothetical protein
MPDGLLSQLTYTETQAEGFKNGNCRIGLESSQECPASTQLTAFLTYNGAGSLPAFDTALSAFLSVAGPA